MTGILEGKVALVAGATRGLAELLLWNYAGPELTSLQQEEVRDRTEPQRLEGQKLLKKQKN